MRFNEKDKVICISEMQKPESKILYVSLKVGYVYTVKHIQPAGFHEGQSMDRITLEEIENEECRCCGIEPGYPAKYFRKVYL